MWIGQEAGGASGGWTGAQGQVTPSPPLPPADPSSGLVLEPFPQPQGEEGKLLQLWFVGSQPGAPLCCLDARCPALETALSPVL